MLSTNRGSALEMWSVPEWSQNYIKCRNVSIHYFEIKSLASLQQRWKIRNVLRLHYLLMYGTISVNNENIKQLRKCALWFFFLLLTKIYCKKWHKDEFENYQHVGNFSDKISLLHYHHHIKSGLKMLFRGESF